MHYHSATSHVRTLLALTILSFGFQFAFAAEKGAENIYKTNGALKNVDKAGEVGLGLALGSTPGLTAKGWTSQTTAFAVGLGFLYPSTALTADYLWHWRNAFTPAEDKSLARSFVPYLGLGAIGIWDTDERFVSHDTNNFGLGLRVPAGIEYLPRQLALGFYAEVDPGLGIVPNGFSFLEASIGGRYYF